MTNDEITEQVLAARKRVQICCDEKHYHQTKCLYGDPRDITICALAANLVDLAKQCEIHSQNLIKAAQSSHKFE